MLDMISDEGWKGFIDDLVRFIERVEILSSAVMAVEVKLTFKDETAFSFKKDFKS